MSERKWNDRTVSFLTLMWPVASATEIAEHLGPGFTRMSVIGKAHRLHLAPIHRLLSASGRTIPARSLCRI